MDSGDIYESPLKQLYEEEWQRASEEDRPRSSFYAIPERGVI